jgi:hypothetical protein
MMTRLIACSLLLVACAEEGDVVGPFTGETRRFVVDSFTFPATNMEAREMAADLTGEGGTDNSLGMVIATLANMGNVTEHSAEMVAAGAVLSSLEITADDFRNDDSVSVTFIGAPDEDATPMGGRFRDGTYVSNRTATTDRPGRATLHLPVFVDADPSVIPAVGLQMTLEPDGAGGYYAEMQGAVPHPKAIEAAYVATQQMVTHYPSDHIGFLGLFDAYPRDWVLQEDEFLRNSLITALMAPDVTIERLRSLSVGFRMHLSPCAEGSCTSPSASCFDRVKNGDETDVDCGGSCRGCVEGSTCTDATDCETAACDGGVCGAASCSNGVRDSFESDVDCGTYCGVKCATGQRCYYDSDCVLGCGAPCSPDQYYCSNDYGTCN